MRDDRHKWHALNSFSHPLTAPGVTITRIAAKRQTVISGPRVLTQQPAALGWPDIARGESYSLALRRDRLLIVNGDPLRDGWHANDQLAVSDATDAYMILQLEGPGALEILKQGAALDPARASASTARLLFGIGVLIYRYEHENCFRLHVPSAMAQALWQNLEQRLISDGA